MKGAVFVGTSGWHYKHWKGPFYPEDVPTSQFLRFYAARFGSVEINNSFYSLPRKQALRDWCDTVPSEFVFAAKASRYITHMKRLKEPEESTKRFLDAIETLGSRLGAILFQLPPRWPKDEERLVGLLAALPDRHRYAFEFRDASWFDETVYSVLRKHQAAFCIYDLAGEQSPRMLTADWTYIRLHGPDGAYQGTYSREALEDWARFIEKQAGDGKDVFCFFDNDQAGHATENARVLSELMGIETQHIPL